MVDSADSLLSPETVAVVGDDATAGAVPSDARQFAATDLHGDAIATDLDLAVVATAEGLRDIVDALVEASVGAILVAVPLEDDRWYRASESARAAGVPLLGPNAAIALPERGLRVGVEDPVDPGSIALVGEDKLTVGGLLGEAHSRDLSFSAVLATGTGGTVAPADVLGDLDADPGTDVILSRPDRIDRHFLRAAGSVSRETALAVDAPKWACTEKPIDVAAAGEIAPAALRDAALAQVGVLGVHSLDRLLDLAPALAAQPLPADDGVAIVSNAGGPGVMATDAVGTSRLSMADLTDETVERLEEIIPDRAYAQNPLDLLADSDVKVLTEVLDVVLRDPGVQAAVVITAPNPIISFEETAEVVADARAEHDSPVVTALMGGESTADAAARLRSVGVPNYFDPFQAVAVIEALANQRDAVASRADPATSNVALPAAKVREVLAEPHADLDVLDAAGIPVGRDGDGVSVAVTATRVPRLGPVLAVGIAEYAAVLGDVSVRIAPPAEREIRSMIDDLRASRLLKGARGTAAVDVDSLVDAIRRVGAIPDALEGVETVHATLQATDEGVSAVDATVDHQ
ncbi:MAG: acetate--CoA ligase family protein [Halanaeroarchaeum sp.]